MVIMFEAGQLGNQLFQYAAVRASKPRDCLCLVGMNQLKRAFHCPKVCPETSLWGLFSKVCRAVGYERMRRIVKRTRIATLMSEVRHLDRCEVKLENGLLNSVTFCTTGFYQYPELVSRTQAPSFKSNILAKAEQALLRTQRDPRNIYFLHHRRGDYLTWPTREHPAVLPQQWYETQVATIRSADPQAAFIVVGDDAAYLNHSYRGRSGFFLPEGDEASDLATMSLCQGGGILSASSFSWWGAYLNGNRFGNSLFLAPKFWIGHKLHSWYPSYIKTKWITYVEVM